MHNIDRFNDVCARVFADLYESFPVGRNLSAIHYDPLEGQNRDDGTRFAWATIEWLENSGCITSGGNSGGPTKDMAVLTPKGLEVLNVYLASLDSSRSLGDELVEASSTGARDVASKLVSEGLTALFNAGLRASGAM